MERDCSKCKHYKKSNSDVYSCELWDCNFEEYSSIGKWVKDNNGNVVCSKCGYEKSLYGLVNEYCRRCGSYNLGE